LEPPTLEFDDELLTHLTERPVPGVASNRIELADKPLKSWRPRWGRCGQWRLGIEEDRQRRRVVIRRSSERRRRFAPFPPVRGRPRQQAGENGFNRAGPFRVGAQIPVDGWENRRLIVRL